METINPKALNLDALYSARKKVTLGFKCSPQLKLQLANEAQRLNLTLSEYMESIAQNYDETVNHVITQLKGDKQFYENEILLSHFAALKGKVIPLINERGEKTTITINSPKDVYTVLINSFKISKQ